MRLSQKDSLHLLILGKDPLQQKPDQTQTTESVLLRGW